jgi:type II secretory pathway component PulC
MTRVTLIVIMLGLAARASANPAPLHEKDLETAMSTLADQTDEPVGLLAIARIPKLGLEKGDLVRAINGAPALTEAHSFGAMHIRNKRVVLAMTVLRGKKELVITLHIKPGSTTEHTEREYFVTTLDRNKQWGVNGEYRPVTRDGNPSGVVVEMPWFLVMNGPEEGDIIRRIDGKPVTTADEVAAALEAARDHAQMVLDIDRLGEPFQMTVVFDDSPKQVAIPPSPTAAPIDLSKIKKINDTTYEVPSSVIDAVLADPMGTSKGARVVPAVKDGKPDGFKLYAIRPSSIFAALGLQNGDTLEKINNYELTSADKALEAYTKIRDSTNLKVEITRRGKTITIEYRIK